jgi:hypothetical protein
MSLEVIVSGLGSGRLRVPPPDWGDPAGSGGGRCRFWGWRYSKTCVVGEMFRVRYDVVQARYRS